MYFMESTVHNIIKLNKNDEVKCGRIKDKYKVYKVLYGYNLINLYWKLGDIVF